MEYVSYARTIRYGYVLLGYREAQGASAIPVQGLRYGMYAHIPGSYRSRSDVVDMRRNPDIPLEFARVGFCIHFSFFLVSVGHHDAFVGYRVVINRVCTHTLTPLQHHLGPLLINTCLLLGRLSFTSSAERSSRCRPLRYVLTSCLLYTSPSPRD